MDPLHRRPSFPARIVGPVLCATLALAVLFGPEEAGSRTVLHLQLDRSAPEADATVPAPEEIRLWFSQEPQPGGTSLRLIRDGEPVETGELQADEENPAVFAAPVPGTLAPGEYAVSWRAMAADGHVVRGDFVFTVRAED